MLGCRNGLLMRLIVETRFIASLYKQAPSHHKISVLAIYDAGKLVCRCDARNGKYRNHQPNTLQYTHSRI